jgi:hypothetical protein
LSHLCIYIYKIIIILNKKWKAAQPAEVQEKEDFDMDSSDDD